MIPRLILVAALCAVFGTPVMAIASSADESERASHHNARIGQILDDRDLVRKGKWKSKASPVAFNSTLSKSKDKGATLTSKEATVNGGTASFEFGPGRGKVKILVGGVKKATVKTAATKKKIKRVRFSGNGVITLRVAKPGKGIYVDAATLAKPAPPSQGPPTANVGEIIITEWLSNPASIPDSSGEWFELHNVSGETLSLSGCKVASQSAASVTLSAANLATDARYLVARSSDDSANGGIFPDATFNFALPATGSLTLTCGDTTIDAVTWSSETVGKSTSLDPDHYTAADNDVAANYCPGSGSFGSGGDFGTPRELNPQCV